MSFFILKTVFEKLDANISKRHNNKKKFVSFFYLRYRGLYFNTFIRKFQSNLTPPPPPVDRRYRAWCASV